MHGKRTKQLQLIVHHHKRRNFVGFHNVQCVYRQYIGGNGFWIWAHDLLYQCGLDVQPLIQHTPSIASGKNADELAIGLGDSGHAQAFAAHFQQRVADSNTLLDVRDFVVTMHDI